MSTFLLARWIHVLAAASWFGAVVLINVAIVPALGDLERDPKREVLVSLFPRIFRFASWASLTAVAAGGYLAWVRFSSDWSLLWSNPSGRSILAGGCLGVALTAFHFLAEPRLEKLIYRTREEPGLIVQVVRAMKLIPRGGLAVISAVVILMMYGARGL